MRDASIIPTADELRGRPPRADAGEPHYRAPMYASYASDHAHGDPRSLAASAAYFRANIAPHLPADRTSRIADIACGSGDLLAYLAGEGYIETTGVDRSEQQIALAHQNGVTGAATGDAFEFLAARSGALDVILAIDFLEHLAKQEVLDLLWLAAAALRPGGRLIVQTCNGASPLFGRIRHGDFTHETAFTDRSIVQAFLAAGLKPSGVYGIDPTIHGAHSLARAIAWRAIKAAVVGYLAVETGVVRGHIVSQNLIAVATRDAPGLRVVL